MVRATPSTRQGLNTLSPMWPPPPHQRPVSAYRRQASHRWPIRQGSPPGFSEGQPRTPPATVFLGQRDPPDRGRIPVSDVSRRFRIYSPGRPHAVRHGRATRRRRPADHQINRLQFLADGLALDLEQDFGVSEPRHLEIRRCRSVLSELPLAHATRQGDEEPGTVTKVTTFTSRPPSYPPSFSNSRLDCPRRAPSAPRESPGTVPSRRMPTCPEITDGAHSRRVNDAMAVAGGGRGDAHAEEEARQCAFPAT